MFVDNKNCAEEKCFKGFCFFCNIYNINNIIEIIKYILSLVKEKLCTKKAILKIQFQEKKPCKSSVALYQKSLIGLTIMGRSNTWQQLSFILQPMNLILGE